MKRKILKDRNKNIINVGDFVALFIKDSYNSFYKVISIDGNSRVDMKEYQLFFNKLNEEHEIKERHIGSAAWDEYGYFKTNYEKIESVASLLDFTQGKGLDAIAFMLV